MKQGVNMAIEKKYLTDIKVSEITGLSLPKLRNDRHLCRGIPYVKVGRSCRYSQDDVIAYMEARKINTHQD